MEQEYKQIRKGSGFVYACANMLYRRVKTEGIMFIKASFSLIFVFAARY